MKLGVPVVAAAITLLNVGVALVVVVLVAAGYVVWRLDNVTDNVDHALDRLVDATARLERAADSFDSRIKTLHED